MDIGDIQRSLATTLRFSLTSRRVASIAHDVHTIATEMGRRPGVNMEEVLVRMLRVLGGLAEEPDSWRAEITNSFNREFTDDARIVSAALRGHQWLSDGASAFETMQVLSQSLLNNIKEAPTAIVNAAAKIAKKFMFWKRKEEEVKEIEEEGRERVVEEEEEVKVSEHERDVEYTADDSESVSRSDFDVASSNTSNVSTTGTRASSSATAQGAEANRGNVSVTGASATASASATGARASTGNVSVEGASASASASATGVSSSIGNISVKGASSYLPQQRAQVWLWAT